MRFVSRYPELGLGTARTERFAVGFDGYRDLTVKSLTVRFSQNGLLRSDIDVALAHWPERSFTGRWIDDEMQLQPVSERIGVFDTVDAQAEHGWSDEEREIVEEWMLGKSNIGDDFIQVEKARAPLPWPTYGETAEKKVATLAAELGLVDEAIAFESENAERAAVLAALEAAKPTVEVVAA